VWGIRIEQINYNNIIYLRNTLARNRYFSSFWQKNLKRNKYFWIKLYKLKHIHCLF